MTGRCGVLIALHCHAVTCLADQSVRRRRSFHVDAALTHPPLLSAPSSACSLSLSLLSLLRTSAYRLRGWASKADVTANERRLVSEWTAGGSGGRQWECGGGCGVG